MALTTDDKVAMLRAAWNRRIPSAATLSEAIQSFIDDAQEQLDEDLNNSASNSHSSSSNLPGSNRITDQETVRGWNQIVSGYKATRLFLVNCAKYAQDAFAVQRVGCFPNPLPDKIVDPAARVIIDPNDQWEQLCEREEIAVTEVVNAVVDDEAIYLWLLNHPNLLNQSSNISESRGFYGHAIVGRTAGGF